MAWWRRKNIDQLDAAATLADSNRFVVAQTGAEGKWGLLSQLFTYIRGKLGNLADQSASAVNFTGGSMTGVAVHGLPTPAAGGDAATKTYVDALAMNVGSRGAVRVASTANVTIATGLAAGQTVDGKTLVAGDLVLLKDQSTASQNGIYFAPASGAASRASQFDTWAELPGSLVVVEEGTANADTLWICTADLGGTLGSTSVSYTRIRIEVSLPVTAAHGGLGQDASGFTGILKFLSGVASVVAAPAGALVGASGTPTAGQVAVWTSSTLTKGVSSAVTKQAFLTGGSSGTYTTPAGCVRIEIIAQAAGGGSAGSGTSGATNGGVGGNTTFGTSLISANGGNPPSSAGLATGGQGGTGGATNSPAIEIERTQGGGGVASNANPNGTSSYPMPGAGGSSRFGGGGVGGGANSSGGAGGANTGGGGGGSGADAVASSITGGAGGAGESVRAIINAPAATYPYAVGAGGTAGAAGSNGRPGSAGGSGGIWVIEYYV